MVFDIQTLVYIYIGVCICMVLFNCVLIFYRRVEGFRLTGHEKYYLNLIEVQLRHLKRGEPVEEAIQKRLQRKLGHVRHLQAFDEAITKKLVSAESVSREYLIESKPVFSVLTQKYKQKDSTHKAYFSYLMSRYKICRAGEQNIIVDTMRQFINDKSAYCRENALKALYSFGDEKNVYFALKMLDETGIFHHKKLITDGLLSFEGDKETMAAILWQHLDEFQMEFQISFINYIRIVSGNYKEKLYSLFLRQETDKELKIVMLRYFGKYTYEPIQKIVTGYLIEGNDRDWEITAVAATILREYGNETSIGALKQALCHRNWYVRFNAAESLNYMDIGYQELASVYNGGNRYAREMLEYQNQRIRLSENAKSEVERQ